MEAVAVYRDGESRSPHLGEAAYAVHLGSNDPQADPGRVVSAGLDAGADAVHPGPAALGRSQELARLVQSVGMAWVGARVEHLAALHDLPAARARARDGGLEVIPWVGPNHEPAEAEAALQRLGPPLLIRGLDRRGPARRFDDLDAARAWLAAGAPWPNLVERAPKGARRVIFVVVGDGSGNAIHLGAHEASVPDGAGGWLRECPPPGLGAEWVGRVGAAAADALAALSWQGVGGVELVVAPDGGAWCTDLDPALPVGFGLHDQVYGVDLVAAQITLAAGEDLGWDQASVGARGAAVEARLAATAAGSIKGLRGLPRSLTTATRGRGTRVDPARDPTIAVLRARGPTRHAALVRLRGALGRIEVEGVPTNLVALREVFDRRAFWDGAIALPGDAWW